MDAHIQSLIDDFSLFDDWEERYAYLIDLGKHLPSMPESLKNDQNLVPGCTSRVWLVPSVAGDVLNIQADSDSHIVRGLVAIIMQIYGGQPASLLKEVDIRDVFQKLGLEQHLSPNRRNGFFSMIQRLTGFY